jgi:hypothetical protein
MENKRFMATTPFCGVILYSDSLPSIKKEIKLNKWLISSILEINDFNNYCFVTNYKPRY